MSKHGSTEHTNAASLKALKEAIRRIETPEDQATTEEETPTARAA